MELRLTTAGVTEYLIIFGAQKYTHYIDTEKES